MSLNTWLHYGLGLSSGKCSALLARLGIDVTAGAICSSSASTATDLVPTHNAIVAHVGAAPALTIDETGWRIGGMGAWLWAAATDDATVYDVAHNRDFDAATGLVAPDYAVAHNRDFDAATGLVAVDYAGTIVRDGWVAYNDHTEANHQTRVAHLLRRCHEMIEHQPAWARARASKVASAASASES